MSKSDNKCIGITFRWTEQYLLTTLIQVLPALLAVCLFIMLTSTLMMSCQNVPADIQRQILIRTIGGCGIVYLSWIIIGEMFLGHAAKTRLQHIMQEMLPTSPLKKFLTQVAWTIILLAGIGVTFCLAHIVCMALFMAFYYFADICRILMDLMSDSFGIDCTTPQALYLIDYHTNLTAGNIGYYLSMASIYTGIFWGLLLCIIGGVLLCHR